MRDYVSYVKEKKRELASISMVCLLLGISGVIVFPHVMEQWSHDRTIGVLHVSTGIVLGGCGIAGLALLAKKLYEKCLKQWKGELLRMFIWYLAVQITAGIIQGLIGLLLYRFELLSYGAVKEVLYILSGVWQNCIRVWFIFLLAELIYSGNWREDFKVGKRAVLMGVVVSVITVGLSFVNAGTGTNVIKVLWQMLYITGFAAYFGMILRRKE